MNILFVLFFMFFCHVFDDYVLQGCLANLKQKKWWEEHVINGKCDGKCDEKGGGKYRYDYVMGLICHSISWSFMIMLPLAIASGFDLGWLFIMYPANMVIHCVVDDAKANKFKINLIQDQCIHFGQIVLTWVMWLVVTGVVVTGVV